MVDTGIVIVVRNHSKRCSSFRAATPRGGGVKSGDILKSVNGVDVLNLACDAQVP
jgi:hypothetical protein